MVAVSLCSPCVSVHPVPVPVIVIARVHIASVPSPPLSIPVLVPVPVLISVSLLALLLLSLLSAPSFGTAMPVAVDWGAIVVMSLCLPYLPVDPVAHPASICLQQQGQMLGCPWAVGLSCPSHLLVAGSSVGGVHHYRAPLSFPRPHLSSHVGSPRFLPS